MSGSANEIDEVKCIIRGLLVSSPVATTINHLEADYRKEEGCGIPFRKFGYPSIEAFLRSIPDTVCLTEPRYGCPSGSIIVQPVQSKKSGHVEKLVVKQKKATNAPRRMKRASAVPVSLSEKRSNSFSITNGLAPSFIPMSLRVSLNRVCRRYAENGLPLSSLSQELSTDLYMAGCIQDERARWLLSFGFNKIEDMIEAFIENGLIKVISKNREPWIAPSAQKSVQVDAVPAGQEENFDDYDSNEDSAPSVSDRMKSNFKTVLKKYPEGLWCSQLPKEYRELTGYNLEVNELGFVSIIQMAMSLKDVFICSRPNCNSDWLLFDSESNSVWNSPAAPVTKDIKKACLPPNIVYNIQSLLEDFPAGIIKHKFLTAYKDKYHEDLPMVDYGFDNLMAILAHLASRNIIHLRFSGNLPMICRPFSNPTENVLKEIRKDNDFIASLYPRDVMLPTDDIPAQPLPENISVGCGIDVLVTEVVTPSSFWYQLWGSDVQAEFNEMMDELQMFYNTGGPRDNRMPDATIQIGQYCVARYPPNPSECGEWHRTKITSLPSLLEVEVFYVDYGSKCKVRRSEIRFLDKRYGKLPLQAHKASLVNVRPCGYGLWLKSSASIKTKPVWSSEASNSFLKLVENQPLVGMVAGFEQDVMKFALIDTSKENDLHINDLLVYAKMAEFGEMTEMKEPAVRSQASTDSTENEAEAETKLPGYRPPSNERNITTNMEEQLHLQLDEYPLNRTSTSHLSEQNLAEGNRYEVDSGKVPSESDAPMRGRTSPLSSPSSLGKGRFGPEVPELHLGRMTSSPRSAASSPISPFLPAERSMFESDTDGLNLGSPVNSPWKASSPRPLPSMERSVVGPEICGMPLEHAVESQKSSTTSPVPQQNAFLGNMQPLHQGNTLNNMGGLNDCDKALKVQLELERLQLCQQQLQYQQFQTQLLLMAAQSSLMMGMPTVSNPIRKVVPPPPGLPPLNPLFNSQPNIMDLSSNILMNPNLLNAFQTPSPLNVPQNYGSFPLGNVNNPQFPANSMLNQNNIANSVGSSILLSNPPQTISLGTKAVDSGSVKISSSIPTPSLLESNLSGKIPDQRAPLERQQGCEVALLNSNKATENEIKMDKNGVTEADASYNSLYKNVDLKNRSDFSPVGRSKDKSSADNKTNSEQKSENETLHSSLEACSINSDSIHPSKSQIYKKRDEEQWKVLFEVDDNSEKNIFAGSVNGKPVQVLRICDMYYVLTEEILGLFYSSLPVHVAMKIAKLKANGKKIESIVINARKDKVMYKRILSLVDTELIADGSDIHLTSIESLHYLCSSLELSD